MRSSLHGKFDFLGGSDFSTIEIPFSFHINMGDFYFESFRLAVIAEAVFKSGSKFDVSGNYSEFTGGLDFASVTNVLLSIIV